MKRYLLIGAYTKEGEEKKARCIDIITRKDDQTAYDDLINYMWFHQRDNLEKYDIIFLISDDLKSLVGCASSWTSAISLGIEIENNSDLKNYKPVFVDCIDRDERILLSNILGIDLV